VRIEGVELPGRVCGAYAGVHVGVQRRGEPFELVPGDAPDATWEFDVTTKPGPGGDAGAIDVGGPFAQGRRGDRFLYLTWGTVDGEGTFTMFRRAKLHLADVDADVLDRAATGEGVLVGRLGLTDECGMPRCARVRPPTVRWSVEP
jgi:hypothetical protein